MKQIINTITLHVSVINGHFEGGYGRLCWSKEAVVSRIRTPRSTGLVKTGDLYNPLVEEMYVWLLSVCTSILPQIWGRVIRVKWALIRIYDFSGLPLVA